MEIIDSNGKIVKEIEDISSGTRINVQDLPAGKYFIQLLDKRDSDFIKSSTFIKID